MRSRHSNRIPISSLSTQGLSKLDSPSRPRRKDRIDHRRLNSTGRIVTLEQEDTYTPQLSFHDKFNISQHFNQFSLREEMQSNSEVEATILLRDIEDLIDKNPVTSHQIINNEATVFKLQEMRTSLRGYEILLKKENLQQDLINQVACTLSSVNKFIKSSNDCKQKAELLQNKYSYHETCHEERSMLFVISDVQRIIAELINNFSVDLEALTDAELLQLKSDLSSKCELVNKAAQKYELILQTPFTKAEMLIDVKHIGDQYENVIQLKTDFTAKLHSLLQSDVYKHNLFTASKLNILLVSCGPAQTQLHGHRTYNGIRYQVLQSLHQSSWKECQNTTSSQHDQKWLCHT